MFDQVLDLGLEDQQRMLQTRCPFDHCATASLTTTRPLSSPPLFGGRTLINQSINQLIN